MVGYRYNGVVELIWLACFTTFSTPSSVRMNLERVSHTLVAP